MALTPGWGAKRIESTGPLLQAEEADIQVDFARRALGGMQKGCLSKLCKEVFFNSIQR